MTPRCVIWAAVSTKEQAQDDKESIPAQIDQARQMITDRGWQEVAEPLVVPGQSRSINWLDQAMHEIPQMAKLIEMAEAGKIDLVVVRDWDRLARTESLRVQISTRLREQGVQVYSLNQPVEPSDDPRKSTDTALIVEGMSGILSEVENRLRVRRHRMGMLARVKKGLWPGMHTPYGYRYNKGGGVLEIKEDEAEIVRRIYRLAHEGKSQWAIVKELNLLGIPGPTGTIPWVDTTVSRILRRPTYTGYVRYGGNLFEGKHEPIIDRDFWGEVQRRIDSKRRIKGRAAGSEALLIGLIRCGYCRRPMKVFRFRKPRLKIYYGCVSHHRSSGVVCRANYHLEEELMGAVLKTLSSFIDDPSYFETAMAAQEAESKEETQKRRHQALEALAQIEDRRERQFIAYEKVEISLEQFAVYRQRLEDEEEELKGILAGTEEQLRRTRSLENTQDVIDRVLRSWDSLDRKSLKQELMALLESIYVLEDGSIEVVLSK